MKIHLRMFALGIASLVILTLAGCGTSTDSVTTHNTANNVTHSSSADSTNSTKTQPSATSSNSNTATAVSNVGYAAHSKNSLGTIISGIYGVQGQITNISQTQKELKSITIKVSKPLTGNNGLTSFSKGTIFTIHFDESWTQAGTLKLHVGDSVQLTYGQFVRNSDKKTVYGSNFSWLYIGKNGVYYNKKGQVVINHHN
jgi:hypothetical protein